MKKITITFPDDVSETAAISYAHGIISKQQENLSGLRPGRFHGWAAIFNDNRTGYLYRLKSGIFLHLDERKETSPHELP